MTPRVRLTKRTRMRAATTIVLTGLSGAYAYTVQATTVGAVSAEGGYGPLGEGLVSGIFFAGAAVALILGVRLAERVGLGRAIGIGFGVLAGSAALSAILPPSLMLLVPLRLLAGAGAGLGFATGAEYARQCSRHFSRPLVIGLYGASFPLGSILTFVVHPTLDRAGPWRLAYLLTAGVALAMLVVWATVAPMEDPAPRLGPARVRDGFASAGLLLYALVHSCGFGLSIALTAWLPLYWMRGHALGGDAASWLSSIVLLAMVAGRFLGGSGFPPATDRGYIGGALLSAAAGVLMLAASVLVASPLSLVLAVTGLVLAGLGSGLPYSRVVIGAVAQFPASPAGAQAVIGFGAVAFAAIGPAVLGVVLEMLGSLAVAFAAVAGYILLVALLFLRWHGERRPIL